MQAVFAAERALGREPIDVSAAKVGYDIESRDPITGHLHFLEVKGRIETGDTITVTTNEMIVALNAARRGTLQPLGHVTPPKVSYNQYDYHNQYNYQRELLRHGRLSEPGRFMRI